MLYTLNKKTLKKLILIQYFQKTHNWAIHPRFLNIFIQTCAFLLKFIFNKKISCSYSPREPRLKGLWIQIATTPLIKQQKHIKQELFQRLTFRVKKLLLILQKSNSCHALCRSAGCQSREVPMVRVRPRWRQHSSLHCPKHPRLKLGADATLWSPSLERLRPLSSSAATDVSLSRRSRAVCLAGTPPPA